MLFELLSGKNSFNHLLSTIHGMNSKTLAARLDEFEKAGLITRHETSHSPRSVRYDLTEKGEEVRFLTRRIAEFTIRWRRPAS